MDRLPLENIPAHEKIDVRLSPLWATSQPFLVAPAWESDLVCVAWNQIRPVEGKSSNGARATRTREG
jgi:hypothetical protein